MDFWGKWVWRYVLIDNEYCTNINIDKIPAWHISCVQRENLSNHSLKSKIHIKMSVIFCIYLKKAGRAQCHIFAVTILLPRIPGCPLWFCDYTAIHQNSKSCIILWQCTKKNKIYMYFQNKTFGHDLHIVNCWYIYNSALQICIIKETGIWFLNVVWNVFMNMNFICKIIHAWK